MQDLEVFGRFAIALLIGILIGLEREHARLREEIKAFAGIRTFPLIALLGATAALISDQTTGWTFGLFFLLVGGLVAIAYAIDAVQGRVGLTSEMAAAVVFVCGALTYWGYLALSAALAVVTFGFLALKPQLHGLAQRISGEDLYATLKFAIISLIILPVLPNQDFGPPPFDAFNPHRTWLMVVFISGISFLGYVLIKIIGPRHGIGLTGLLGGLASSTAVTLSFSQRSKEQAGLARAFSLAILLAWTVMFGRVVVEVAVINLVLLGILWLPMAAAMAVGLLFSAVYYFARGEPQESDDVRLSNPFELGPALKFGLLYAVILLAAKIAQFYFDDTGVYVASLLAGLADVDAITISMAQLAGRQGGIALPVAARSVLLAVISNTFVKGVMAISLGSRELRRVLVIPCLALLLTAVALALFAI